MKQFVGDGNNYVFTSKYVRNNSNGSVGSKRTVKLTFAWETRGDDDPRTRRALRVAMVGSVLKLRTMRECFGKYL